MSAAIAADWIGVAKDWHLSSSNPLEQLVSLCPEHLRTGLLATGASGYGKTTFVQHLIAQDIARRHSAIVIDPRGDLVESFINMCAAGEVDPNRIHLLDLREKQRPAGYNPLGGAHNAYYRALGLLEALEVQSGSWGVQVAQSVQSALLLLAEAGQPLTRIEDLFYDDCFRAHCLACSNTQSVIRFWERYEIEREDSRKGLIWPVLNKVSPILATETLRKVLGHPSPIDIGKVIDEPGSILLVSLAIDELHGASRMLGSLILASIAREVFSRAAKVERNPVRIYVDEFEHFAADFEMLLVEGRRFNLSLVLAHQSLVQLTPKMRSIILNNVGVKVAFRCGRDDAATLCRDLTGDPNAVDLNDLPPGEALMWVRGHAAEMVEINEPLPAVRRTAASMRYRANLVERQPLFELPPIQRGSSSTGALGNPSEIALPRFTAKPGAALEDWL